MNKLTIKQQDLLQQVRQIGGIITRQAVEDSRNVDALNGLVRNGYVERVPGSGKLPVYRITERGRAIRPATPKPGRIKW